MSSFSDEVYAITRDIPPGYVSTYGDIAKLMGRPGAARAVGQALRHNPTPIVVPCHRVVSADLKVGSYMGQPDVAGASPKADLLRSEGVLIRNGRVARQHLWPH